MPGWPKPKGAPSRTCFCSGRRPGRWWARRWPQPVDQARIVEAAADLEAQFEEGLIDADELLNEQCVVACATEALAAFSDERLAAGVEAARAWVETLFAAQSQPEVATSEQVRARVLRQVAEAGAKGDVARVCHRLAGLGRAGHRALVREAVAALEGLVGDLSKHGGLARRALTFCPGRSALLAQDDHDDANVIAGLFRDGERERARALAEGLLAFDAAVVFGEDLLALAPVVLHEEREGEQRLREVAEQLVADLPSSLAEVDAPPARATVIHVRAPTHEAKLVEDLEDEASALVFADHLQALGDPRGELVVLLHHRRDYEAREHLRRHSESLLGPLAEYTRRLDGVKGEAFTWRRGFIDAAVLGYSVHHAMAETAAPVSLEGGLEALATHPSGQVLSALVIATNELDDGMHFGPATEVLGRHDWPALRRLRVGRVFSPHDPDTTSADFDYQISWMQLADLRTLWARVPRLEALTVQGALSTPVLVDVSLPRLKSLRLLSGGLAAENTRAVAQADWPSLESLELWFGDAQYGFSGGVRDLSGLLGGARVPRLRSLGLKNAMFADELIEPLAHSALLARLEVVSLDLGMLSRDGAQALVRNWPKFAHLRELSLTLNCLTDDDVDQLSGLGDTLVLGDQKDPQAERYVSVGE